MTATINNHSLAIIEYQDQRVITLADVDRVHERADGTARRNFNSNREHFIIGEDYFEVPKKELSTNFVRNSKGRGNPNILMILLTETGYLMLVKSFTDNLAWNVQRELVKSYFKTKQQTQQLQFSNPLLEQNMLNLQRDYKIVSDYILEHAYEIGNLIDKVDYLSEQLAPIGNSEITPYRYHLLSNAVELNTKRLYALEWDNIRQKEILNMLVSDNPIITRVGKALMKSTEEYKIWVRKSVVKISSKRQVNTLCVYRELYSALDTNAESREISKKWRDAIRNDSYLTYKTFNQHTLTPDRSKLIRNIFDAVCYCGETDTYQLKDMFTKLIVERLFW